MIVTKTMLMKMNLAKMPRRKRSRVVPKMLKRQRSAKMLKTIKTKKRRKTRMQLRKKAVLSNLLQIPYFSQHHQFILFNF